MASRRPRNVYRGISYYPEKGTEHMRQPLRVPRYDPGEKFERVRVQLYGAGSEPPANPWPTKPPMSGFALDYAGDGDTVKEVMGAYSPEQLPVLSGLATHFAISDRWFASVPTQTNANRAFSICGTSLGGVDNGTPRTFDAPTLFNVIDGKASWGIYWQYNGPLSGDPQTFSGSYTTILFPRIKAAVGGNNVVDHYRVFINALKSNADLPAFCYLEPFWSAGKGDPLNKNDFFGIQGNDYHPPAWVGPAEAELNKLYELLIHSKQWQSMLFIVTFDEHGGTWDHEPPPVALPPDNSPGKFDFTRLGVRVPTILISPFIQPGTVFRAPKGAQYDFEHTSFIATVLKWAGLDPRTAGLGARVANAPTFEDVLQKTSAGVSPPHFTLPPDYESQGGGAGTWHLGVRDNAEGRALLQGMDIQDLRAAMEQTDSVPGLLDRLTALMSQSIDLDSLEMVGEPKRSLWCSTSRRAAARGSHPATDLPTPRSGRRTIASSPRMWPTGGFEIAPALISVESGRIRELLESAHRWTSPTDVSADGRVLLYDDQVTGA